MKCPYSLVLICVLAISSWGQTAFLADSNNDILYTVDISTGAATVVGSTLPMVTPSGLAHDGTSLYSLDLGGTGEFNTLSPVTGAPTILGSTALNGWQDVCFDATTGQFLGVNQNDTLYSITPAGVATLVAPTTPATLLITAIAVDAAGVLWGVDFSAGQLGTIDKMTAIFTTVVTTITGIQGMSFHPLTGVLYASSTNTDSLYTIDTVTGTATLIGPHGNGVGFAKGFCFEAAPPCPVIEFQINSPQATLNIDGVQGTPCTRAQVTRAQNVVVSLNYLSITPGAGYDTGVAIAPLVPLTAGGFTSANGQIVNLDITAPTLQFLFGGALPNFAVILPGSLTIPVTTPSVSVTLSAQMIILSPTHPDGFAISQGVELVVL